MRETRTTYRINMGFRINNINFHIILCLNYS